MNEIVSRRRSVGLSMEGDEGLVLYRSPYLKSPFVPLGWGPSKSKTLSNSITT